MVPLEKRLDLLKIIAHPVRIKILEDLTQGVKCVSDFEDSLDISQPNVSQHLKLLRSHNIVDEALKTAIVSDSEVKETA